MPQVAKPTAQQVVFVSDKTGRVVHTHQFVDFGELPARDHDDMQAKALDAARRLHGHDGEGWTATMCSVADLEQHWADNRPAPPKTQAS